MSDHSYDIAYSLGDTCGASLYLRRLLMRFASGPLDWLSGGNLRMRTQTIANHFQNFMNEADLELRERDFGKGEIFPHDFYFNTANGLKHYHDFKTGVPLEESYPQVQEKYKRRIARFENDCKSKRVLLIWFSLSQTHSDEEIQSCCNNILNTYKDNRDNIHFVIIEHRDNISAPFDYHRINNHAERYLLNINDSHLPDYNVTMGNTKRVAAILTNYTVQNSRTLQRRLKIKRFFSRLLTACIPIRSWRKSLRRKFYGETEISW